ncbi:type III secretion system needle length determinant, SpaN/EivJ family [Burkholderia cepacia]|uniref:SpaN/EivJ family type III secretion system needle length determinant n=1 Tax=Burkholderia cepacia TaxID=292 RepID=UPI000A71DF2C|nr:type III secretion system needle length determinant, SpaN/EivJ family [Burkholderia cepacia]
MSQTGLNATIPAHASGSIAPEQDVEQNSEHKRKDHRRQSKQTFEQNVMQMWQRLPEDQRMTLTSAGGQDVHDAARETSLNQNGSFKKQSGHDTGSSSRNGCAVSDASERFALTQRHTGRNESGAREPGRHDFDAGANAVGHEDTQADSMRDARDTPKQSPFAQLNPFSVGAADTATSSDEHRRAVLQGAATESIAGAALPIQSKTMVHASNSEHSTPPAPQQANVLRRAVAMSRESSSEPQGLVWNFQSWGDLRYVRIEQTAGVGLLLRPSDAQVGQRLHDALSQSGKPHWQLAGEGEQHSDGHGKHARDDGRDEEDA